MQDNYQEEVGTQMKSLVLILERTWQLAWMFYFLRIVCFAYKGFHFLVNFDCSKSGRPSACCGEDKSRVNCLETENGCGMQVTSKTPVSLSSCQTTRLPCHTYDVWKWPQTKKKKNCCKDMPTGEPDFHILTAKNQFSAFLHITM